MTRAKVGLSRDEHTELGLRLAALRDRLGKISVALSAAFPLRIGDMAARVQWEVDELRSQLDGIVFREYPTLSTKGNISIYYPAGHEREAPRKGPAPAPRRAGSRRRKPGYTREAHIALARELVAMHLELFELAERLGRAYPKTIYRQAMKIDEWLLRLRNELDKAVARDFPDLGFQRASSIYFPGPGDRPPVE